MRWILAHWTLHIVGKSRQHPATITWAHVSETASDVALFRCSGVSRTAVEYGIERLNSEVAAWMRGDDIPDGNKAQPPFLAMG